MERMSSMDIGSLPDSTWGDIVEQGGLGISFDESPDTVLLTTPGEGGGIAAQLSKRGSTQMRPRNSSLGTSYDAQRPALSTRLCVPPRPFFARLPVYPRSRAPHRISDPRAEFRGPAGARCRRSRPAARSTPCRRGPSRTRATAAP